MKRITLIFIIIFLLPSLAFAGEDIQSLRAKYRNNPRGLSSWLKKNISYSKDRKNYAQKPYQTVQRGKGDCEDFAILSKSVLGKGAIMVEDGKHAILLFEDKGKRYRLSNGSLSQVTADTFKGKRLTKYTGNKKKKKRLPKSHYMQYEWGTNEYFKAREEYVTSR